MVSASDKGGILLICQLASTSSEDSSSCSGESGRLRSGRLRLGVRMGTRRHQLDNTSSSDQSCDTVIYVGSDGCPISDHELTDYERPPTSTTARSSDDRTSSGQDGSASGSQARVRGKSATFRSSLPRAVGGRHSDGELAASSRHPRGSLKPPWRSPPPPPPLSTKKSGEMWIDGPKSMMTRLEQWVDGPPEFRHTDDNHHVEMVSESDEQQPSEVADGDSLITELTERRSPVEASAVLTDDFHVIGRSDDEKRKHTVLQSPLRTKPLRTKPEKINDVQFTVVDVHQSAGDDGEVTEVFSTAKVHTSPDVDVDENHTTSNGCVDLLSVERRSVSGRTKLDIDALLLANRESIYELQMDEELERGSRESLLQLVCGSDDDWSTCGTEPRRSKCPESDSFGDLDACLKDLDSMAVTTSERSEPKTPKDAEGSHGERQENKQESANVNVVSEVVQNYVWIGTTDVNELVTNCVESDNPARNVAEVPTADSFKTDPAAVATPTTNRTRQSALPMPVSSSPSRVRRKPPPIPVRLSSVTQSADRSTNARTTSTNSSVSSTPPKTCSDVVQQNTLSDSKNGSASRGFCSRDCSAAREADVTTGIATVAATSPPRGNGVVTGTTDVVDANQPASVPPPSTKSRSKIALPCRRDKKTKHQLETSTCSGSPSRPTASPSAPPITTSSRDVLTAVTLISPYHSITKPRTCRGPGSDNSSSVLSSERAASASRLPMTTGSRRRGDSARGTRSEVEASSGYESMIRDSEEVTGTSSASECQSPLRLKANKMFRKKGLQFLALDAALFM